MEGGPLKPSKKDGSQWFADSEGVQSAGDGRGEERGTEKRECACLCKTFRGEVLQGPAEYEK